MTEPKRSRKGLKICCGVIFTVIIILVIVCVALFFTVFKPKDPVIKPQGAKLQNVQIQIFPTLNLRGTMALNMTIENRNYEGFHFKKTTNYVDYHGMNIAEIPIEEGSIPAKGELNLSTYTNITGDKFISSPYFLEDFASGRLNFTSTAKMHGKFRVLKAFKFGAKVLVNCDISVEVLTLDVDVKCRSKLKL